MNENDEIKRALGELCIKGFGAITKKYVDDKKYKGMHWDITRGILQHMQDDPSFYYDVGELIFNYYQKWQAEQK